MGSKANIHLLIFLATTLHTSVHNLSYSAAATTTPKWFWELNLQNTLQQSIYSSLIWVSFATVSPTFGAGHQSPQSSSQSSPGRPRQSLRRPAPLQATSALNLCSQQPWGLRFHSLSPSCCGPSSQSLACQQKWGQGELWYLTEQLSVPSQIPGSG